MVCCFIAAVAWPTFYSFSAHHCHMSKPQSPSGLLIVLSVYRSACSEHLCLSPAGKDHKAAFSYIEEELSLHYPGHILPKHRREWIMLNAGGWMGAMYLLHASVTEYVLLFGTGIDTSGHSGEVARVCVCVCNPDCYTPLCLAVLVCTGRYWANISDTILAGSFRQWKEGAVDSVMYKPGTHVGSVCGEIL